MGWQPTATVDIDPAEAESAGVQGSVFLLNAIRHEVDGARIDPIQLLMDPHSPEHALYAVTAVVGPLRNYLATAWGPAGHVTSKQIVAHGTLEESRQAAAEVVRKRLAGAGSSRGYVTIGTYSDTTAG